MTQIKTRRGAGQGLQAAQNTPGNLHIFLFLMFFLSALAITGTCFERGAYIDLRATNWKE